MTTLLLIGGPADGKYVDVKDDQEFLFKMEHLNVLKLEPDRIYEEPKCITSIYRRFLIRTGNVTRHVMVDDSVDDNNVMEMLINSYKRV